MPSEMPMPKSANTVFSTRSSVSTRLPNKCSHSAIKKGLSTVLAMVFRAKRLPSTHQPSSSMTTLTTVLNRPMAVE